ncbi:uncharacterized protein NPIL_600601 [Nephila pilipes]|uniref:Secreted protein n=1 Tax=Nephila pilipes TaxID=299642 RepID=A0A8X6Q0G5_NEPPI|nr:uncharacterized protein NPIL_290931 [Nephila pilipes]GFT90472.1 uncharacterized protein NPIL_600601 [Nephila pilipes]
MGKILGQFALLPFWCLCDGMVSGTGRTQHRHMIVACELESSFKDIWQYKIRYDFPNSGRAKKCVKIQDAFHLARAIVYVSQRKAGCDGRIPTDLTEAGPLSHFHMNRPLHEHSIAFLCTLFPGGIQQLLLEQNRNKDVVRWESESVCVRDQWFHKKWGVPIHLTGWKFITYHRVNKIWTPNVGKECVSDKSHEHILSLYLGSLLVPTSAESIKNITRIKCLNDKDWVGGKKKKIMENVKSV